MTASLLH